MSMKLTTLYIQYHHQDLNRGFSCPLFIFLPDSGGLPAFSERFGWLGYILVQFQKSLWLEYGSCQASITPPFVEEEKGKF